MSDDRQKAAHSQEEDSNVGRIARTFGGKTTWSPKAYLLGESLHDPPGIPSASRTTGERVAGGRPLGKDVDDVDGVALHHRPSLSKSSDADESRVERPLVKRVRRLAIDGRRSDV